MSTLSIFGSGTFRSRTFGISTFGSSTLRLTKLGLLAMVFATSCAEAQSSPSSDHISKENATSPARKITRQPTRPNTETQFDIRTYDGSNNHLQNQTMGQAHIPLLRFAPADYDDGIASVSVKERGSARLISNIVFSQSEQRYNAHRATDMLWQWGQFLDHDIDLTDGVTPAEPANIIIPTGDNFFDPNATGTQIMPLNRSLYDSSSGTDRNNPRQQINEITAWIDASNVYGSSQQRAEALRTLDGTGKLKTSAGNLLPFNEQGLANAGGNGSHLFLAGDVRANEQVGLTAMHTLFVREHNRLAEKIAIAHPSFNDEEIFQSARRLVAAQMQKITFDEFLPVMLGKRAIRSYRGYQPELNGNIRNEFSTAAYRLGHSLLSPTLLRLNKQMQPIEQGHLSLREAFFSPAQITNNGISSVLRGLVSQQCQSVDTLVIDDVRNFLFGQPGAGGFDLVALNIQRGRDHGLASYNDTREAMGLVRYTRFEQITKDIALQARLENAYQHVDHIDLWVGGLAEDQYRDAMVGELFFHIIRQQFETLRNADRFWYQRDLSPSDIDYIETTTSLSRIIRRNTKVGKEIQKNAFLLPSSRKN